MNLRWLVLAPVAMATLMITATGRREDPDPAIGTWRVYSDRKDGSSDGRVRTFMLDGKLVGVVDVLPPDVPADSKCTKCSGVQKDKPVLGLMMMWGFQKDGDSWTGGTILEPQTGSTYKCKLHFAAPDALEVRGYIGVPLLGRSQTWKRVR